MNRSYYHELAAGGLRMPIGVDLVLHEHADHESRLLDGDALGAVVAEAAQRYGTPLAFPLMDLRVEKEDLLHVLGLGAGDLDGFHFAQPPQAQMVDRVRENPNAPLTPRMAANAQAIRHIAGQYRNLVPMGMAIGPFSLMTKLLSDPITAVFLSGSGLSGDDEPDVLAMERALELATLIVERGLRVQCEAGAKAVCVCEPAANQVFISPTQLESTDVWERLVMAPNCRIKAVLDAHGADLVLHDCGELTDTMVRHLATLDPAVLSLGSSRQLPHDASLVPERTVLFGNLPTKRFYSDTEMSVAQVEKLTLELADAMRALDRPFILGSECDVLSVPGAHQTISRKVHTMLHCGCPKGSHVHV
ncbi:MAG: uroporphyrinogen decarboxylase family protein [Phycisphaeraceae bacterium]